MTEFDPSNLNYDAQGLIPAIAQDRASGDVLMLAWMNRASIEHTIATGKVTYFSRSRNTLWIKGETSGHVQTLVEMRVDCDRDALLVIVDQVGPACHTNHPTCFHTAVRDGFETVISKPL